MPSRILFDRKNPAISARPVSFLLDPGCKICLLHPFRKGPTSIQKVHQGSTVLHTHAGTIADNLGWHWLGKLVQGRIGEILLSYANPSHHSCAKHLSKSCGLGPRSCHQSLVEVSTVVKVAR